MSTGTTQPTGLGGPAAVATAIGAGLLAGGLTAFGQAWLPDALRSLANSSGSWSLLAFALALVARHRGAAALSGFAALACMLLGYVLVNEARGYPSSTGLVLFWSAAAVVAGPLLGAGAHLLRWSRGRAAIWGVGAISGVLVGEGAYGLLHIADTTYPPYWWGEIVVGVLLLLAAHAWRFRRWSTTATAALLTAAVAAVFVLAYSNGGALMRLL
ncbi:DUF6518 family protein [Saccharopolyspora sp. CA-218241]|uniref:DUF6518 family protein n=1 Tax=Saccharopolyspora sp. CA-218241 TaxID=3240027 RepID=UPI003D97E504